MFLGCSADVETKKNIQVEEKPNISIFSAEGMDSCIKLKWSPISDLYDGFISYQLTDDSEEIVVPIEKNQTSLLIENLVNATKDNTIVYKFTMTIKDKSQNVIETQIACATPAVYEWEYDEEDLSVWMYLLSPDAKIPQGEDYSGLEICSRCLDKANIGKIKGAGLYSGYPVIYNNPESVTALVEKGSFSKTELYQQAFLDKLKPGEEIQWFSTFRTGYRIEVYGKIVNSFIEENGYTEVSEYYVDTAQDIKNIDKGFRVGTKVITKGYYSVGDGGNATYVISNRPDYKYGSLTTSIGQYCNIQCENNYLNLKALGAGKCFQVTKANYSEWENYKTQNSGQGFNDDGDRIEEAIKILVENRQNEKETITLFIPKGNYRLGTGLAILEKNFVLKGETVRRDLTPEEIEDFEKDFALGNEIGSSNFDGTVLYTDNGSNFSGLNIYGPATNVVVEGITLECRETDSKRTFWHSESDPQGGPYTDINYEGRGTCEPTQADQQWFSRQVQISQCSNVTIRNCEFIITSHIRDEAVYPSGSEYNSDGGVSLYRSNPYVEACDLHTDKQFTSVTFFDSWHNVTVDDCLLYNMSGVFRGANFGFLDIYGGQCNNGTLSNSTLYHNCHDEQIGIFTLTENAGNYKESEYIDGVNIVGNKIYPMRDEHVDKIKTRVMVFSVGYDGSKNIRNVNISGNEIYAENLPSKLMTFGGFMWDGRKNVVVKNNTINMKNSGGVYMFETRPYVQIKNNTINLDSDSGKIGGSIFDCTNRDDSVEPQFCNNTINVNCDYTGSITHNGGEYSNGIVNGNKINIKGNQTGVLFGGNNECSNNEITINGRMKTIYNFGSWRKLSKDVLIKNNCLLYNFDDTADDYSKSVAQGGFFQTGREGCTFVDVSKANANNNSMFIYSNFILAPNCTTKNKHMMRYSETELNVYMLENVSQKFNYLRGISADNDNVVFGRNYEYLGKIASKEDWCIKSLIDDTE